MKTRIFTLSFLLVYSCSCLGAEIGVNNERKPVRSTEDSAHIYIAGEIVPGDFEKFETALTDSRNLRRPVPTNVIITSPGGDIETAMRIGRLARSEPVAMYIINGAECSSACVLIFSAGVQRWAAGAAPKIGLHRPTFADAGNFSKLSMPEAQTRYNEVVTRVQKYLLEMGIGARVIEDMLATGSEDVSYPSRQYLMENNIIGDDPAFEEWERAKMKSQWGDKKLQVWDEFQKCINMPSSLLVDEHFSRCRQLTGYDKYDWSVRAN